MKPAGTAGLQVRAVWERACSPQAVLSDALLEPRWEVRLPRRLLALMEVL